MKHKSITIIFLLILTSSCNSVDIEQDDIVTYGYLSLESMILNSTEKTPSHNDPSGLIILLSDIDNERSRKLLVKLTNYYLGSAISEALMYSILSHGREILNHLEKEVGNPINCFEPQDLIVGRCLTLDERNLQIQRYIELIESGSKLDYVL